MNLLLNAKVWLRSRWRFDPPEFVRNRYKLIRNKNIDDFFDLK
jgi:hypothetical protein